MLFVLLFASLLSEPYFFEPFEEDSIGTRWIVSEDPFYNGTWAIEPRQNDPVEEGTKGLVTKTPAAFHGISTKHPFEANGKEFVIQYEVKVQEGPWDCGGAYIKILNEDFVPIDFNSSSKFVIMFGPDKCGSKNKVHFIYRTQNPKNGFWQEHRVVEPPLGLFDNMTHLYRLVLTENDDFEMYIDGEIKASGPLSHEFMIDPPFSPPALIPDYKELKPLDWVDVKEIVDPTDAKPDDWDEDAPAEILDMEAVKPDDWDESMPLQIPDPDAKKPEDWNDEEDGVYEVPLIDNPECTEHGCGKWERPVIKNPAYKGKWKPRMIPNPEYKGEWKPKDIPNPNYFLAENLHLVGKVTGVGIDILNLVSNTHFDNIYIGASHEEAQEIANATWVPRHKKEVALVEAEEKRQRNQQRLEALSNLKDADLKTKAMIIRDVGLDWAQDNMPIAIVCGIVLLVILFGIFSSCARCCCGAKKTPESVDAEAKKETPKDETKEEKKEEEKATKEEKKEEQEKAEPESPSSPTEKKPKSKNDQPPKEQKQEKTKSARTSSKSPQPKSDGAKQRKARKE